MARLLVVALVLLAVLALTSSRLANGERVPPPPTVAGYAIVK